LTNLFKKLEGIPVERIPDLLHIYEEELKGYEANLKVKGKTIGEANKENASWMAYYDERRIEINSVIKFLEVEIARIRGKLYKSFTEGYPVDLGERAKERYIDNEPAFLKRKKVLLEVEELYSKYQGIVKAFEQRGYDLRNLTQLKVAAIDNVEI